MKRMVGFVGIIVLGIGLTMFPQSSYATLYYPESPHTFVTRLLKTDSIGDTLWTKTYEEGFLNAMQQTEDGGYIFTGSISDSVNDNYCLWLLKTDSMGNMQWSRSYNQFKDCYGYMVQQTVGGGYIIIGRIDTVKPHGGFNSNMWLLNVDSNGDTLWTRFQENFSAKCVQRTPDSGYVVIGNQLGPEKKGSYTLNKLDYEGNSMWIQTFGGNNNEWGTYFEQTLDEGFVITGSRKRDIMLLKTDLHGKLVWRKSWGEETIDRGYCVHETSDGGFIIAGEITNDFHLIKTDCNGKTLWIKNFSEECHSWAECVQETREGGYIVIGQKGIRVWILKTDTQGNILWERTYFRGGGGQIQQSEDGGYIILAVERIEL